MKKFLITLIIIIICIFLYGRYIEINNLKVNYYNLPSNNIPTSFKDLKIVQFSDLLYEPSNEKTLDKLVKKINNENADIIIFSGDLLKNGVKYQDKDYNKLKDTLKKMNANLYKYAVIGENDQKYLEEYKDILYEGNFNLLDNNSTLLFYKDEIPIKIIGLTDTSNIENLLESELEYKYTLAITHKPDNFEKISNYNIDATLSGHSLGGIINIPLYSGLIKKDGAQKYINNHYKLNKSELFISNGLGYHKFNFRLFNSPSINVYKFTN